MKVNELTGAALDWAVAKCEGKDWNLVESFLDYYDEGGMHYSTDWSQGGPIIEREGINLTSCLDEEEPYWIGSVECQYKNFNATAYYEEYGPTPLIAAMRCFVASKLGDEVEIPEELK